MADKELHKMKKRKNKNGKFDSVSRIVNIIFLIASVVFFAVLYSLGFIPNKYLAVIAAVLIVFNLLFSFIAFSRRTSKFNKGIQIFINTILAICMIVASIMIPSYKTKLEMAFISLEGTSTTYVNVYVLADNDDIDEVMDLDGALIAVQDNFDLDNQTIALNNLTLELSPFTYDTQEYSDIFAAADALFAGEVDAMILNESYAEMMTDIDGYDEFLTLTKVVYTVEQELTEEDIASKYEGDITKNAFIVLIGGNDTWSYSNISASSRKRTDVNILLVVNPVTTEILMVTIPRDSYLAIDGDTSKMDKLTHSSVYGISAWRGTVESAFDLTVDFYIRVNFSSIINIVDAIGGLDIYNPYTFKTITHRVYVGDTSYTTNYTFEEGDLHLDGVATLFYVRERKNLSGGDFARNEHQAIILEAMIDTLTDISILSNVNDLFESISGTFTTDMDMEYIYDLIEYQLDHMPDWTLTSYSLTGTTGGGSSYALGGKTASMVYLSDESVEEAKTLINKMLNNESILETEEDTTTEDTTEE